MRREPEDDHQGLLKQNPGSLSGCLIEGDAAQRTQERRIRRRSLALSIVVQGAVLVVLVLFPLFGKPGRIVLGKEYVPIPPYGHRSSHLRSSAKPAIPRPSNPDSRFKFSTLMNRPVHDSVVNGSPAPPGDDHFVGNQPAVGPDCAWCVDIGGKNSGPRPPQPTADTPQNPRVVQMTQLDPAMLIRRVEPIYPPLAMQVHREGRVELRAVIGTDGTIQSLQIVSGDALFEQSALQAVRQWRYRPTILNGQSVEIDTYITVIYTMRH